MITASAIFPLLKKTLQKVMTDEMDGIQSKVVFPKFCQEGSMEDYFEDMPELAGPGLASEKPEGTEIALGSVKIGFTKRFIAGTWALKLHISEEAIEDNKYMEAVPLARMLKKAVWRTADVCAALMLVRAENAAYVGGDGVPLASNAHPLPHGGTFSNTMATPLSPSIFALQQVRAALAVMPDLAGIRAPIMAEKVVFPIEQQSTWDVILGSAKNPEPGQFNAINIGYQMGLEKVAVHHWTNTSTNWCVTTDAGDGLMFMWRKKPSDRTWMDNDITTIKYSQRARWDTGWANARGLYFVGA